MKNNLRKAIQIPLAALSLVALTSQVGHAQKKPVITAVSGQVVMRLAPGMTAADASRLATAANCRVLGPIAYSPGYYLCATNDTPTSNPIAPRPVDEVPVKDTDTVMAAAAQLSAVAGVIAEPNYIRHSSWMRSSYRGYRRQQGVGSPGSLTPNDPRFGEQWNMQLIHMPQAYAVQLGTKAVIAADIDSGLDITHPDFAGAFTGPMNFTNPVAPTTDVTDTEGHGTATAGLIRANTNNGAGIGSVAGWNRNGVNVTLLPIKASLGGFFTTAAIIASTNYAVASGAGVINESYGGTQFSAAEASVVQTALAAGVIIVASAGNTPATTPSYPASYPGVINVSAVNINSRLTSYSTYGGTVTITAPGGDFGVTASDVSGEILTTAPVAVATDFKGTNKGYVDESTYGHIVGTSFSAPQVTGAVALLLAEGAPAADVKTVLQATATVLDELPNNNGGNKYGAGLLNVGGAVSLYANPTPTLLNPESGAAPTIGFGGEINDRGTTYLSQPPILLKIRASNRITNPSSVTVDVIPIQPSSSGSSSITTVHLVGGTDFTITPATINNVPVPNPILISIPKIPTPLGPGPYKIVATITTGGVVASDTQFINIVSQVQPTGRRMFSLPFIAQGTTNAQGLVPDTTGPEATTFGAVPFRLFRWDSLNGVYGTWSYVLAKDDPTKKQSPVSSFQVGSYAVPTGGLLIPSYQTTRPAVSISPIGLGYWLDLPYNSGRADGGTVLNLTGPTVSDVVAVNLIGPGSGAGGGWNMIGSPYTFAVNWGAVSVEVNGKRYAILDAVNNGFIRGGLIGYSGSDYVYAVAPLGQLQPFQGYWVQAQRDCILIIPPAGTRSVAPTTTITSNLGNVGSGWQARLIASVGGDTDGQNFFGQVNGADTAKDKDKFDITKPPSGAGHAYLRLVQPVSGRNVAFARDMRPLKAAGKQDWLAAVTSDRPNANVVLSWEGISTAPRRSRLYLTDLKTGNKIAMNSRSSYTFKSGDPGTTRQFKITAETAPSVGALAILNVTTAPTRGARTGYAVHFTTNQDAVVTGSVRTISNKVIANLNGASRAVGATDTTLHWDGRSVSGDAVPGGLYYLEITARTDDGQVATMRHPVTIIR